MASETVSSAGTKYNETAVFTADGILFDMVWQLQQNIAAVFAHYNIIGRNLDGFYCCCRSCVDGQSDGVWPGTGGCYQNDTWSTGQ